MHTSRSNAGSIGSNINAKNEKRSGRYRKVGRTSLVDESLFGTSKPVSRQAKAGKDIVRGMVKEKSNQEEAAPRRRGSTRSGQNGVVRVLSTNELDRIRNETTIVTLARMEEMHVQQEQEADALRRKAKERKVHMMKKAEESAKRAPKSEMEKIIEQENEQVKLRANHLREQAHDSVKYLKTLGARASAFTIRDQQIQEYSTRFDGDKLYDAKMNLRMEIDRLEDLKRQGDTEEAKRAKRIEDRKVLEQQIVQRQEQLRLEQAKRQREGEEMLEKLRLDQEADAEKYQRKIAQQQKDMEKVMEFNEQAKARKLAELNKIKAEEEEIVQYQLKKDLEQKKLEEEEERRKQEAELRCAALRSTQEKAANDKAQMDELRAKRAAEAKERKARQAEIELERRRVENLKTLSAARQEQARNKLFALEREASLQQQEYQATMSRVERDKQRLEEELGHKAEANRVHRESLQTQIEELQRNRKQEFDSKQADGRALRTEYDKELDELESIRVREVKQLIANGVNPKYLSEMKSIDMSKIRNC